MRIVSVRIPDQQYARIMAVARASGMSVSDYIRAELGAGNQNQSQLTDHDYFDRQIFILTRLIFHMLEFMSTPPEIKDYYKKIMKLANEKFSKK